MTNEEMLIAISDLFDAKIKSEIPKQIHIALDERLTPFEERVCGKLTEHDGMLNHLEERMDHLEERMDHLEERMDHLEERMDRLEERMDHLEERMDRLEKAQQKTNIILENRVLPQLADIQGCYVDTCQRFQEKAEAIDALQLEVDVLKKVVQQHSEKLEKIEQLG